jgi:hypothetical protein
MIHAATTNPTAPIHTDSRAPLRKAGASGSLSQARLIRGSRRGLALVGFFRRRDMEVQPSDSSYQTRSAHERPGADRDARVQIGMMANRS